MNPQLVHLLSLFLLSHPTHVERYPVEARIESVKWSNTLIGPRADGVVFVRDKDGFREDKFTALGCRPFSARTQAGFDEGSFDQTGRLTVTLRKPAAAPNVCKLRVTREGALVPYQDVHR